MHYDIEVNVVKASDLKKEDFVGMDAVFTAGGDGTFLKAASMANFGLPIIGVNTDPSKSQGFLCCSQLDMTGGRHPEFDNIVRRLATGDFRWLDQDRLVVTLVNADGRETELPIFALNELLLSVRDPAKASIMDVGIDNLEREKVRCSGIIVCTGTGSTAWYESAIKVHADTVEQVLQAANVDSTSVIDAEIVGRINSAIKFKPDDGQLGFVVREPIVNDVLSCKRRTGKACKISIKSLVWNGLINIDGLVEFPFNYGVQAVIKIGGPETRLRTVRFGHHSIPSALDLLPSFLGV